MDQRPSLIKIYWKAVQESLAQFIPALPILLLMGEVLLCSIIIVKVPYTEIDWKAYMQQVKQVVHGERDYTKISGGTGPLVYPAAHVYTYTVLYHLTKNGNDIRTAQMLFAGLQIAALAVVLACYREAKAAWYILPLLVLSKRLHSIFMLRCFNDCFAVFFLFLSIYFLQRRQWTLGSMVYAWGLSTKMSLLVSLPGVAVVLFLGRGFRGSLRLAWLMLQVQIALGLPFLAVNWRGYLTRAFELNRRFLFRWTVNWRFVGEHLFLGPSFALTLLILHAAVLTAFIMMRWLKPAQKWTGKNTVAIVSSMLRLQQPFTPQQEVVVSRSLSPSFVMTTVLTSNMIGMLFARSLHYQFYAYIAWVTPFLLWRSGLHPVLIYIMWALQEWAWNVYPSTNASSAVVVSTLAITVALVFAGAEQDKKTKPIRSLAASESNETITNKAKSE